MKTLADKKDLKCNECGVDIQRVNIKEGLCNLCKDQKLLKENQIDIWNLLKINN